MPLPCVILAGGLATRMRPLTENLPKSLLPVCGRPFADLQLEWLRSEGVERAVFSIGHLGGMIRERIGDGSRFGMDVTYVDEGDRLLGTGGALRLAVDSGVVDEDFLVLNGDSYLRVDIPAVERAFRTSGLPALMTVLRNRDEWDLSNVVIRDGRVALYDKRRPAEHLPQMEWIDYGLHALNATVLRERIRAGSVADLADLMRDLSAEGRLAAFEVTERFYEIGSPEGLSALERRLDLEGDTEAAPK